MTLYAGFGSQEEIDGEYDVLAAEEDADRLLASHFELSAETRSTYRAHLEIPYGPTRSEYLDIYPADQSDAPVLIFFHGGWWSLPISGPDHALCARGPVRRGITTVIVNYALAPQVSIDEIVRQARSAVAWVHRNVSAYGGSPDKLVAAGHSAGGHLVGMLALTDWVGDYGLPADTLKAGLLLSGLFDLDIFRYSWLAPKLLLDAETVHRQSPLRHVRSTGVEMLVALGGCESREFHRQSRTFAEAWQQAGNKAQFLPIPGETHLTVYATLADPTSVLIERAVDLIRRST